MTMDYLTAQEELNKMLQARNIQTKRIKPLNPSKQPDLCTILVNYQKENITRINRRLAFVSFDNTNILVIFVFGINMTDQEYLHFWS